jgi:hypothetical protein
MTNSDTCLHSLKAGIKKVSSEEREGIVKVASADYEVKLSLWGMADNLALKECDVFSIYLVRNCRVLKYPYEPFVIVSFDKAPTLCKAQYFVLQVSVTKLADSTTVTKNIEIQFRVTSFP